MKGKATANLNVRKNAGVSYTIVKTLSKGTVINILSNKKVGVTTWYKIDNNQWVSGKYVNIINDGNKNEITVTPNMSISKIQECLKESGCTIRFTKGTYKITKTLYLYSDTKIILDGAILVRKKKCYLLMTYVNSNTTGYNGEKNITIQGGTIIANGNKGITNIINIIHAQNITIKNVHIKNNVGCHAIEINSSKDVIIEKCHFDENIIDKKNAFREAIQIDFAFSVGLAYVSNKSAKCYDDTHCNNIKLIGNKFDGYNVAIGTHTQTKSNKKHTNIKILNNTCNGVGAIGGYGSCFKLINMDDVLIDNNIISGFARGIEITTAKKFYNKNGTTITAKPSYIDGCKNIIITRNLIKQPSKDFKASGVYIVTNYDDIIHDDITIENNVFDLKNGVSKYDVFYDYATNVKEKGNKVKL